MTQPGSQLLANSSLRKNNLDDPVTRSTSPLSADEEGKGASIGSFFTLDLLYLERPASIFVLPYSDFAAKRGKKENAGTDFARSWLSISESLV